MRIKVLVRRNLKMSPGKQSAQVGHAMLGLYKQNPQNSWACVVLEVSDRKFEEAKEAHPDGYVVVDAGLTEVAPHTETCIAWYEDDPNE